MRHATPHGFSLIELLVSVSLLAIISSLAIPAYSHLLQRNRQQNLQYSLLAALSSARNSAVAQKCRIELCGSSDGNQCDQQWHKGWLIREPLRNTPLRFTPLDAQEQVRWSGAGKQSITYQVNGTTLANNGRFVLCTKENQVVWQVVLNRQGRARQVQGLEAGQADGQLCR